MNIRLDKTVLQRFPEASQREWLETNGLGGWASSTVSGAHTRRYHGLLVAATHPPVGRVVLLSKLEETIVTSSERFELGCNQFPNAVSPSGFTYLTSFEKDLFPTFEFSSGNIRLRKTVVAPNGENATLVLYEVLEADDEFTLELRPFVAGRDYHSMTHANDSINRGVEFADSVLTLRTYNDLPPVYISVPNAEFYHQPEWYYNFEYAVEQFRGLDFREDLFTHGIIRVTLRTGDRLGVVISTEKPEGRDAFLLAAKEKRRRETLIKKLSIQDDITKSLSLAADQFIVRRGSDLRTIIAGYHWFSDWGRDTMIALPGICLVTGRFDEARLILRAFAQSVSEGMLPNRFPDAGEQPEYNTVDATLWFFVAIHKYLEYTGDDEFVRAELFPVLKDIIAWHDRGTRYKIKVDPSDGLLNAGEPGVQLTWMDAKIGDWVVTPRQGKAVEINALWYNALMILAGFTKKYDSVGASQTLLDRAARVRISFETLFWNDAESCLVDYVDAETRDAAIRPNQIFALGLPFTLLDDSRGRAVLAVVENTLYTPVGLRSLSPGHSSYRPSYGGDQWSRDSAYHQGTVWSWLIGPLCTSIVKLEGEKGRMRARKVVQNILPHLQRGGLGTISEIFDADAPHHERGCTAQAWSVGEVLRTYVEDVCGVNPAPAKQTAKIRKTRATVVAQ